jgi:SAM-dependent methyltransferase
MPEPRIDDPALVAREYADTSRLAARRRVWHEFAEPPTMEDDVFDAVMQAQPRLVVEVGCGAGGLAARIAAAGPGVVATDLTFGMVAQAHAKGLPVVVGDAARIPIRAGVADVALASAMLYHVPDLDRSVDELARILGSGGRLVASTFGPDHLREVWDLIGAPGVELSFNVENGVEVLSRRFAEVRMRRGKVRVTFPDVEEVRAYVAATLTRSDRATHIHAFDGPFVAHGDHAVFVAEGVRGQPRA